MSDGDKAASGDWGGMARLDVLIYGMNYAPERAGVGRYTGELGAHLAAIGKTVLAVTAPPHYPGWTAQKPHRAGRYARETIDGVAVHRCPLLLRAEMRGAWRLLSPLSFALSSAPVVAWHILTRRPRVVLCVEPTLLAAPVAILAARLAGSRLVLHVQDLEVDAAFAVGHLRARWARRLAVAFERAVLKRFDKAVAISRKMRERLIDKGVPRDRVAIVRNWVDLNAIRPLPGLNGFRDELGIGTDDFVGLYAGNIGAKQALDVALEAAEALADRGDIVFVVAGEGPEKRRLVERYGHLDTVRFLPFQPEERLNELLSLPNVHLLPQERKVADLAFPSKAPVLLASGRTVLATVDEGTELYDLLNGTAVIVPAGDSSGIAREILALADGTREPVDGRATARLFAKDRCLRQFCEALGLAGDEAPGPQIDGVR